MFSLIKKHKNIIIIIGIFLIASGLRFYNPLFRSIWGDEAHSIYSAIHFSLADIIQDSHLPAYFLLLSFWIKIFGSAEYTVRLLSMIIGSLAVIVYYLFIKDCFNEKTAVISTTLLAFSPLAIMHSQEMRVYGLLMVFSIFSCWAFFDLLKNTKKLNYLIYLISTIILLLIHVYGLLILLSQLIILFIEIINDENRFKRLKILFAQALAFLIVSYYYIKIFFMNYAALAGTPADMAFSVFPWYLKIFLFFFVLTLGETLAPWNLFVVVPAGMIYGLLFIKPIVSIKNKYIMYSYIICLLPVIISVLFLKPSMPKYLITCLPFYLIIIGHSILTIRLFWARMCIISLLAFLALFPVYNYYHLIDYHNSNQIEPWRDAAAFVEKQYRKGDVVLASTNFVSFRIMDYYLNITGNKGIPIYDLEKKNMFWDKKPERIYYVENIHDDRAFPPGYIENIKKKIGDNYILITEKKYIPYESTLVAKLPIERHPEKSFRITISLYEKREI